MSTSHDFIQPGHAIVGTCSLCGGAVTVPTIWHGIMPPTPTCSKCGATKADTYGKIIPMEPGPRIWTSTQGTEVRNDRQD